MVHQAPERSFLACISQLLFILTPSRGQTERVLSSLLGGKVRFCVGLWKSLESALHWTALQFASKSGIFLFFPMALSKHEPLSNSARKHSNSTQWRDVQRSQSSYGDTTMCEETSPGLERAMLYNHSVPWK